MPVATTRSFSVTLPDSPYPRVAVEAALHYESADPYAVRLAFPPLGECPPVGWVFGRDLLNEGRHAPAGVGDVTVSPGPTGEVLITLRGGTGRAVVSVPGEAVTGFLLDSFALVPAGRECEHLDLDGMLDRLRS